MAKDLKGLSVAATAILAVGRLLVNGELCAAATSSRRCNMTQQGLLACLPAITGMAPAMPSAQCCFALANTNLSCLCACKNSPLLSYLHIDPKLAMQLPAICWLLMPKQCKWVQILLLGWSNGLGLGLFFCMCFKFNVLLFLCTVEWLRVVFLMLYLSNWCAIYVLIYKLEENVISMIFEF